MKKKFLAIAAIAIMIPLVLCACKKEQPETPTEAASEAVTEPQTQAAPTESAEAAVNRLLERVNTLKYVHGVALEDDPGYVYYDESGYTYTLVTDTDFQSIGAITEYLFDTFTANGATDYYPDLALMGQGDPPYPYVMVSGDPDVPDGLYELQAYGGFSTYEIVSDIAISNQSSQGFTADFTADMYGAWVDVTMKVVAEDGPNNAQVWKIDSLVENWE